MAQRVKILKVQGNYAITQDGKQLQIIGNVRPQQYAYTDGVVVYGYGVPDFGTSLRSATAGGLVVYKNMQLDTADAEFTTEELKPLRQHGLIRGGPATMLPVFYNTDKRVWCWKQETATATDNIQKYCDDYGNEYDFTGIILRWRGNQPDLQTGEYLRNDAYNFVRTWTVTVDPQTGDLIYTATDTSSSGWTIAGSSPLPQGTTKTLAVNGNNCNLNDLFNILLQDLQTRHGQAAGIPDVTRPQAQLGKFMLYSDDACTQSSDFLYRAKRMQFDGTVGIINLQCCGICYPENPQHPLDPRDPTQGMGWWPQELYYKARAKFENGTVTLLYLEVVINGNRTVLHGDDGYEFDVDGWTWDSLTQNLTKEQETIWHGARPQAVSKGKNLLFADRLQPPMNSQLNPLVVDNLNESLVRIDDWKKVAKAATFAL